MITGADIKAGYGAKKEKPYNSILPYLKAKAEAEKKKAEASKENNKEGSNNDKSIN